MVSLPSHPFSTFSISLTSSYEMSSYSWFYVENGFTCSLSPANSSIHASFDAFNRFVCKREYGYTVDKFPWNYGWYGLSLILNHWNWKINSMIGWLTLSQFRVEEIDLQMLFFLCAPSECRVRFSNRCNLSSSISRINRT